MSNDKAVNTRGVGIALDEKGDNVLKSVSHRLNYSDLNGASEVSLLGAFSQAVTIPAGSIVKDVFLNVITAEAGGATKTLDVGTLSTDSGDADGFIDGIDVSTTGVKYPTLASAGQTLGALLRADESGAGALVPAPYVTTAEKTISVTPGSTGFTTLVCDVHVTYLEITE